MPIKKIELIGYKRLSLGNIQRIVITMTERLQLILGTNGSGKSSLVREMSALPAHPNNYTKTGSKTVWIDHAGHEYVLTSLMSPSPRHSFKKNNQELNPGGTQSVQRELCLQEFGITPEIHGLLINKERFTQMSPKRRREWFTLLSEVSYDYALSVFARLRDRAKQLNNATVLAKKRLVVEAGRLVSEEEQYKIQQEIDWLHHELEVLQSERAPMTVNPHELQQTEQRLREHLAQIEQKLMRLRVLLSGKVVYASMDSLDADLQTIRDREIAVKALLERAVKEHEHLEKQLKVLQATGQEGVQELRVRLAHKTLERQTLLAGRQLELAEIEPDAGLGAYNSVRDVLSEVFTHLPGNEDRRFSSENFKLETDKRLRLIEQKAQLERTYANTLSQRKVMDSHKEMGSTCCPKCGHVWIAGYSDERHQALVSKLKELEGLIAQLDGELRKNQEELQAIEAYRLQYTTYTRTANAWPVLRPFWEFLYEKQVVGTVPRQALVYLEKLEHDLLLGKQAKLVQVDIDKLQTLVEQAEQLGEANLEEVSKRLWESDEGISYLTAERVEITQRLQQLTELRRNLTEYLTLGEKITQVMDSLQTNAWEQIEALRLEAIHTSIRQVQVALAQRTKVLSEIGLQKRTISDLEQNIAEMETQERVAKKLVESLSPTGGLIADGLLGSIQSFTNEMNAIVRKIWSYPLEIKPCGSSTEDGAELDYCFPMSVNNDAPSDDVSDGSTGQQEIVDLAFRIVAMRRLKLGEAPLMLDEFGAGFDEAHRLSSAFAIQQLIEQSMFSQVFMVSHYKASYGALTQCEMTVLCSDNITLPAGAQYNQHVLIEN